MVETHLHNSRQTIKLGLIIVVKQLFPQEQLKIAYSIQEGVFCRLVDSVLSVREVAQIDSKLRLWLSKEQKIIFLGHEDGYYHYRVEDDYVKMLYPCEASTILIEPFSIMPYAEGFIVDFGDASRGVDVPLIPPDKLAATYDKTHKWLLNIKIETLEDVNRYIRSGESTKLLGIAEALHEKEIADISDTILQQKRALRVLVIAGPSSSGKTSFAERLSTQLRVNGLKPVPLSLDNYFVNRDKTPLDIYGKYDFDSLDALDLDFLQRQIHDLVEGKMVDTPIFDFITGKRQEKTNPVQIGPDEILILEGIHALNPVLYPHINRNMMFKIYIHAIYGLNIDLLNRIPASEIRMMRRLVRDESFRGKNPEETLDQWASVRLGEYNNIFKFQEEADVMFNSSLIYELNALRPFTEESLKKIKSDSQYADTKNRLLNLLSFCEPMDIEKVPFNSILREFIGGSLYF